MEQRYPRNTQLDRRLDDAAARLHREARGTSRERETFVRRSRDTVANLHTVELLDSPSLQPK
jgi:hypothetical protein